MVRKIIQIVLIVIILGWLGLVIYDFLNVRSDKDPKFCIKNTTVNYDEGKKTEICTALGYKVLKYYEDDQLTATEFGPFFIKDKNAQK